MSIESSANSPRRFSVIDIQPTPNPNALKFVLDGEISDRPVSFLTAASAAGDPLAQKLFALEGVTNILLLGDFVTVNKTPATQWKTLSPLVKKILEA